MAAPLVRICLARDTIAYNSARRDSPPTPEAAPGPASVHNVGDVRLRNVFTHRLGLGPDLVNDWDS